MDSEKRFCDKCIRKTLQNVIENDNIIYTYRRKRMYRCTECGNLSYKRGLRPSAESVY